ncbi:MAG: hypothetical protein Q8N56_00210 [bacterium]|nr:hypothetical protein [bacterium]
MLRKKKNGNGNNSSAKKEKPLISRKPPIAVGNYLVGLVFFSLTLIIFLSFFGLAGGGGEKILDIFSLLVGRVIFFVASVFDSGGSDVLCQFPAGQG